jgi:hypothetical protein
MRIAFGGMVAEAWGDQAAVDPSHQRFREGLEHGDMFQQIMWSAIEDLARIGGVNLSEQGA